jgi:hypothetical protein
MMRWLPAVALGLVALGSLLLSAAVLVVPSSTFAQEEEGEVQQPPGGGGTQLPCTGGNACDRGGPGGLGLDQCCIWSVTQGRCINRFVINPGLYGFCNNPNVPHPHDACTNPNPPAGTTCNGCLCKREGEEPACICRP